MTITEQDWQEWQHHKVTEAIRAAVSERITDSKDQLASPDSDANRDRFLKGMIWAFNEVLEARPEITVEVSDDSEVQGE